MITLESYSEEYYTTLLHDFFSRREILKYSNRGGYAMLSLLGIYKSYFMLLKDEKRLLGCGVIRYKYSRELHCFSWWLYDIWIQPDFRGKGYGIVLMEKLIVELRKKRVKCVYLVVDNANLRAQNLYSKMGFVLYEQQTDYKILQYEL